MGFAVRDDGARGASAQHHSHVPAVHRAPAHATFPILTFLGRGFAIHCPFAALIPPFHLERLPHSRVCFPPTEMLTRGFCRAKFSHCNLQNISPATAGSVCLWAPMLWWQGFLPMGQGRTCSLHLCCGVGQNRCCPGRPPSSTPSSFLEHVAEV